MQNRKLADETGRQGWSKDVAVRKASYVCMYVFCFLSLPVVRVIYNTACSVKYNFMFRQ